MKIKESLILDTIYSIRTGDFEMGVAGAMNLIELEINILKAVQPLTLSFHNVDIWTELLRQANSRRLAHAIHQRLY